VEELDQVQRELRLAEQAILRQALEKKEERIAELEAEVTYLRRTLNETLAVPRPAAALAPVAPARFGAPPRRWRP